MGVPPGCGQSALCPWIRCNFCVALFLLQSLSALADSELWKINVDGTECQRFAETPGYRCGSPDWSPDGQWIAYDTWRIGGGHAESQIAVMRADGTEARMLGPGAMPSWSPDGTQIVFHTPSSAVWVVNADGTGREKIIDHWGSPRWSPKGNRIAVIRPPGSIALFDCAEGTERTIFRGPYSLRQGFGVSPDGLRFCFADMRGGVGLATLKEETMQANVRWLVKDLQCYHASWAPDGRRVVFALAPTEDGGDQLYTMDVDSDTEPTLLEGQDQEYTNTNPDWSPDGKAIIFCRQPPSS
jgi:Tol biopolymer transport system component